MISMLQDILKEPGKDLLKNFDECMLEQIKNRNDIEKDCVQFLLNCHTLCKEPMKYHILDYIYQMNIINMELNLSSLTPLPPPTSTPCGE